MADKKTRVTPEEKAFLPKAILALEALKGIPAYETTYFQLKNEVQDILHRLPERLGGKKGMVKLVYTTDGIVSIQTRQKHAIQMAPWTKDPSKILQINYLDSVHYYLDHIYYHAIAIGPNHITHGLVELLEKEFGIQTKASPTYVHKIQKQILDVFGDTEDLELSIRFLVNKIDYTFSTREVRGKNNLFIVIIPGQAIVQALHAIIDPLPTVFDGTMAELRQAPFFIEAQGAIIKALRTIHYQKVIQVPSAYTRFTDWQHKPITQLQKFVELYQWLTPYPEYQAILDSFGINQLPALLEIFTTVKNG